MSLYEYLDILAQGYERIDFLWNIFIAVHLAIVGGIILINREISITERGIAIIGYLSFLIVNYRAVVDGYAYQQVLLDEIAKLRVAGNSGLMTFMRDYDLPGRIAFLDYAYIAAGVLTVLAILSANILSRGHRDDIY
ncbi:MAG: hypothetical protein ACLFV8_05850 [Alphaproteobacteria bacterium]